MTNTSGLLIFTKVPAAGKVKTRLIPAIGQKGAARVHEKLTALTFEKLAVLDFCNTEAWIAGDLATGWAKRIKEKYSIKLNDQAEGDLGQKLIRAAQDAFKHYETVTIVGTDCPGLAAEHIKDAITAHNNGVDVVLLPVEDGGYALISLKRFDKSLFENICWSSEHVLNQTLDKINCLGFSYHLLETLWDLDRPEDLERYLTE